jgi:hypothetical protein
MEERIASSPPEVLRRPPFDPLASQEFAALHVRGMSVSPSAVGTAVEFPEALRSEASLNVEGYLHAGTEAAWRKLVAAQPSEKTLPPAVFQQLVQYDRGALPTPEHREAGQYVDVIHDLFKRKDYRLAVGLKETDSHDLALARVFQPEYTEQRKAILPLFEDPDFFSPHQKYLIEGVSTTSFNLARFMNSQASLAEVHQLATMEPEILKMVLAHGVHDIAGAQGHRNVESSLSLDQPTGIRILDAFTALLGTIEELGLPAEMQLSPHIRQACYLERRAERLGITIPEFGADLLAWSDAVGSVMIANLLRCDTPEEFAIPRAAYNQLPEVLRTSWALTMTLPLLDDAGKMPVSTIGMDYAPAFLRSLRGRSVDEVSCILGYFIQSWLQVATMPLMEASYWDMPSSDMNNLIPLEVNYYDLAQWCTEHPEALGSPIPITYVHTSNTMTPRVLDPVTYDGQKIHRLLPPDAYRSTGANLKGIELWPLE